MQPCNLDSEITKSINYRIIVTDHSKFIALFDLLLISLDSDHGIASRAVQTIKGALNKVVPGRGGQWQAIRYHSPRIILGHLAAR